MQIFKKTNFDFVSKRKIFLTLSIILITAGFIVSFSLGLDYGIDFEGGVEMIAEFSKPVNTEQIRSAILGIGLTGAEIKSFGGENQYMIRIKKTDKKAKDIVEEIHKAIPDNEVKLLKVDEIGAKIGNELRNQAIIAVIIALALLLIYIAFRFEFIFGLGAVIAIIHDAVVTFTVALVIHKLGIATIEIDQVFLAAMLTVICYSVTNTIIIFDRVRENLELMKGRDFVYVTNTSINETLNRTVITVITILMVLVTLIIFGGPVLLSFALIMTLGTIFGVYSSIYISTSFVI